MSFLCRIALVGLLYLSAPSLDDDLRVIEESLQVSHHDDRLEIDLPIVHTAAEPQPALLEIELLAPDETVWKRLESHVRLKARANPALIHLQLPLQDSEWREKIWSSDRLHYRLRTDSGALTVEGTVALSRVYSDNFVLSVASQQYSVPGGAVQVWVSALHPATGQAVGGVLIQAGSRPDDQGQAVEFQDQTVTGPDGTAVLELNVPDDAEEFEREIVVRASRNGIVREAVSDVYLDEERPRLYLNSDKPLYQPGQTLHLRFLALEPSGRAWAGCELFVRLLSGQKQVFGRSTTTNSLGIAALDWEIPEDIGLGEYTISVADPSDEEWEDDASKSIEIERYELPSFAVEVESERPYYLPGEPADVEVQATRFSGEPVRAAQVRILAQADSRWTYASRNEEMSQVPAAEGQLDEAGVFRAVFDAGADIQWDGDPSARFEDLDFTAYVTDELTGRTEKKRFQLRISREPIHIYLEANQPFEGVRESYLTTFYADGTPAQCLVRVYAADPSSSAPSLAEVETNSYGTAQLALTLPESDPSPVVYLTAQDGDGLRGFWHESLYSNPALQLELRTSQAIYRRGDPLQIEIAAAPFIPTVFLDVFQKDKLLLTRKATLRDGRASLEVPFQEAFSGFLRINAYTPEVALEDEYRSGRSETRLVAYPQNGLEVEIQTDEVYRPGQAASARFRVTDNGRPVRSALGAVIVDQGLRDLVRSRREDRRWSWSDEDEERLLEEDPLRLLALFGVPVADLNLSQPVSEEIQLTARAAFFSEWDSGIRQFSSSDAEPNYLQAFEGFFKGQSARLSEALQRAGELRQGPRRPAPDLEQLLAGAGLTFGELRDPWGNPYQANCAVSSKALLVLTSVGADEKPDTHDDFVAFRVQWPYYDKVLEEIRRTAENYQERTLHPLLDEEALTTALQRENVAIDNLRDPCGAPLRPIFSIYRQQAQLTLESAGADKRFDTLDDYRAAQVNWFYFEPLGRRMTQAIQQHHRRTGSLLWDADSLRREILKGIAFFDSLRDPWGNPYSLDVKVENYNQIVSLVSSGPDGRFDSRGERYGDDFVAWKTETSCFAAERRQIVEALNRYQIQTGNPPSNLEEAEAAMRASGIGPENLLDPWNRPFRMLWEMTQESFESFQYTNHAVYGDRPDRRMAPVKVSLQTAHLFLRSNGLDGLEGNEDDFDAVRLYFVVEKRMPPGAAEETVRWSSPRMLDGGTGSGVISGTVKDVTGAVIPGTEVTAIHQSSDLRRTVISNDEGRYRLEGLPLGTYIVRFWLAGFRTFEVVEVPVADFLDTPLDATLEVGEISEAVMVSSSVDTVDTAMAAVSTNRNPRPILPATPRLRSYFPETLAWAPWLETDREGRARMDFTVADTITTWDLSVTASTADGRIRTAQARFRSFQPFYIQPDPPPVLTVGDEIELPLAVHNYLDEPQSVLLKMDSADWFEPLAPLSRSLELPARNAVPSAFPVRAIRAASNARQHVTAIADSVSDAVEKPLRILPNGKQTAQVYNRLLNAPSVIDLTIPEDALPGTAQVEMKIYPDIVSHAFDGIEGIIQRPFGCAEQTISSTYPNLLVIRVLQARSPDSPALKEAVRQLEKGYRRLQGYRAPQGGFSYWGGPTPAVPEVSLHAWKFLDDARQWIEVDPDLQETTLKWILEQQAKDGSWIEDAQMTGLVARTLASDHSTEVASAVQQAIGYLRAQVAAMMQADPYLLAGYLLSVLRSEPEQVPTPELVQVAQRLIESARRDEQGVYWQPLRPTPFRGWGTAGAIETTAVALQAIRLFAAASGQGDSTAKDALSLVDGAVNFLLLNKDSYGVWHTSQATVAALDALSEIGGSSDDKPSPELEVTVNGRRISTPIQPSAKSHGPARLDLSAGLVPGANRVEIRPLGQGDGRMAQLVLHYARPWPELRQDEASGSHLWFRVSYDRTRLRLGEDVTCTVAVKRFSSRQSQNGMLLAEIGLPPGVDVDRGSLKLEMERLGWQFNSFEVRPDRLVVYLWPRSDKELVLSFRFRPRLVMRASGASSQIYDYYNPDARLDLAPAVFIVER